MPLRKMKTGIVARLSRARLAGFLPVIVGAVVLSTSLLNCSLWNELGKVAGPPTIPGAHYVGWRTCLGCHEDQAEKMASTRHGKILAGRAARTSLQEHGCEACHGPGSLHLEDPTNPANNIRFGSRSAQDVADKNAVCLQCHARGERLFWQGSQHELRGLACVSCHSVKSPQTVQAQLKQPSQLALCSQCHAVKSAMVQNWSHMPVREGKLQCSTCHNVHGTITEQLIREPSINENCYRCHADLRGPFLWEHPPVREDCTTCHVAHGSNNVKLLRTRAPRLCQQCHNPRFHPSTAFDNLADRRVLGRACVACHVRIHGSNHPSGFALTR